MRFINEANAKKCVVIWCGKWCPPQYMDLIDGIKSLNNKELQAMSNDLAAWLKNTKSGTSETFSQATVEIASKHGWECVWDYTKGIDQAPKEMQSIGEDDVEETERVDGGAEEAQCYRIEEEYRAGDIEDFIGNKASNRRAKVVIKENGNIRSLNDIYFKDGKCVIDIV